MDGLWSLIVLCADRCSRQIPRSHGYCQTKKGGSLPPFFVTELELATKQRASLAVVAAIPRTFTAPGRPCLVIGLLVVRVSWLSAARARAVVGRAIGIAERFARSRRRRASVARGCRSYLGCRSYNQQSAESGYDCLIHFLSPLMCCAAGKNDPRHTCLEIVSALQQVSSLSPCTRYRAKRAMN